MKRYLREELYIVLALFVAALVGYLVADDYGVSWDEPDIYNYGSYAIDAYNSFLHPNDMADFPSNLNFYGPSYFMLATTTARFFIVLNPNWSIITAHHFVYYLTFIVSALLLYLMLKRWVSKKSAFGAALIFTTQPLLLGHAFINPKDTPFMSFFLISIFMGVRMFDDSPQFKWRKIIYAGIALGLTTSIRIIAPLAGVLVLLYGLIKAPRLALKVTPLYVIITIIVMYLTWPYLWKSPIKNFFASLITMSNFPSPGKITLFKGSLYHINQIPLRYIPSFIVLQLTEPVLILVAIGLTITFIDFINKKRWEPAFLFIGWFLIPTVWLVISRSTVYDNARQLMFLWPPLFFMVGIALEKILEIFKTYLWKIVIIMVLVAPGLYATIKLHPYQYIYYNSLVGGVNGAARQYELDYWGTSFKEAAEYINQNAPKDSQIRVIGPEGLFKLYARPDIIVTEDMSNLTRENDDFYYCLCLTRNNEDLRRGVCRDGELVFAVERDNRYLSYIKKHMP